MRGKVKTGAASSLGKAWGKGMEKEVHLSSCPQAPAAVKLQNVVILGTQAAPLTGPLSGNPERAFPRGRQERIFKESLPQEGLPWWPATRRFLLSPLTTLVRP